MTMLSQSNPSRRTVLPRSFAIPLAALLICAASNCYPSGTAAQSHDTDPRALELLRQEVTHPFPSPVCGIKNRLGRDPCDNGLLFHALAMLYVGEGNEAKANEEIEQAIPELQKGIGQPIADNNADRNETERAHAFHFQRAALLSRLLRLFGRNGARKLQAISPATEKSVLSLFRGWAKTNCRIADADPAASWRIWGSENHHAQLVSSCWSASDLLKKSADDRNFAYADGSTPDTQYRRWTEFLISFLRQRARQGLVEYDSPSYAQYTLGTIYDYAQFAEDAELRRLAKAFLDIWWAQWASEQVNGNIGASMTRVYEKELKDGSPIRSLGWVYFGIGTKPRQSLAVSSALTSNYAPPALVAEIATAGPKRGTYTTVSTAPGRLAEPKHGMWFKIDPNSPGILRTTYSAPGFVMGTATMPVLAATQWVGASSQNRWSGVVFNAEEARIVAFAAPRRGYATYNASIGVQARGAQLVQGLAFPYAANSNGLRVWFGRSLRRTERDGWVLVDSSAYAAVRPTQGGYRWDVAQPGWMILDNPAAAVIIQVASKSAFGSMSAFSQRLSETRLEVTPNYIDYWGLSADEHVRLFTSAKPPQVNGTPVNFMPEHSIESPFVAMNRLTGKAEINFGGRSLELQF